MIFFFFFLLRMKHLKYTKVERTVKLNPCDCCLSLTVTNCWPIFSFMFLTVLSWSESQLSVVSMILRFWKIIRFWEFFGFWFFSSRAKLFRLCLPSFLLPADWCRFRLKALPLSPVDWAWRKLCLESRVMRARAGWTAFCAPIPPPSRVWPWALGDELIAGLSHSQEPLCSGFILAQVFLG